MEHDAGSNQSDHMEIVMAKPILTAVHLRAILRYDKETGLFSWRQRTANRVHIGDIAGSLRQDGYVAIEINHTSHFAHRLAWLYVTGAWPVDETDHINRVRHDNRWINLREATKVLNQQNRSTSKNNRSGFLGVWARGDGTFSAKIRNNGGVLFLGRFDTAELASAAYLAAKNKLHEFGEVAKGIEIINPKRRAFTDRSLSGMTGVYLDRATNRWRSTIYVDGKNRQVGMFDTAEQASAAYLAAKNALHLQRRN